MEAMRSCLLNGFVVVFVSASVATARTAKSTRDPGIATRRDVAGREGVPRVENAEDAALRPRHPTPLRTTRRVVIIAAIAIGEDSSNARRVASSSVVTRVARERSRQNQSTLCPHPLFLPEPAVLGDHVDARRLDLPRTASGGRKRATAAKSAFDSTRLLLETRLTVRAVVTLLRTLPTTMSALSFTSAVAARPVGAAKAAKASVSTKVSALGGFGPNMPADEYNKKMAAKKATIEANKAKGGAKAGGLFSFGKKEAAPAPPAKKGFGFGAKKAAAPAPKAKTFAKPAFAKKDNKPAALSSFGAGLPGRRKVAGAAAPAEKKGFTLFGKK
jgi:hypothetical protein